MNTSGVIPIVELQKSSGELAQQWVITSQSDGTFKISNMELGSSYEFGAEVDSTGAKIVTIGKTKTGRDWILYNNAGTAVDASMLQPVVQQQPSSTSTSATSLTRSSSASTSATTEGPSSSPSHASSGSVSGGLIGGVVAGAAVLILIIIGMLILWRRRKRRHSHNRGVGPLDFTQPYMPERSSYGPVQTDQEWPKAELGVDDASRQRHEVEG